MIVVLSLAAALAEPPACVQLVGLPASRGPSVRALAPAFRNVFEAGAAWREQATTDGTVVAVWADAGTRTLSVGPLQMVERLDRASPEAARVRRCFRFLLDDEDVASEAPVRATLLEAVRWTTEVSWHGEVLSRTVQSLRGAGLIAYRSGALALGEQHPVVRVAETAHWSAAAQPAWQVALIDRLPRLEPARRAEARALLVSLPFTHREVLAAIARAAPEDQDALAALQIVPVSGATTVLGAASAPVRIDGRAAEVSVHGDRARLVLDGTGTTTLQIGDRQVAIWRNPGRVVELGAAPSSASTCVLATSPGLSLCDQPLPEGVWTAPTCPTWLVRDADRTIELTDAPGVWTVGREDGLVATLDPTWTDRGSRPRSCEGLRRPAETRMDVFSRNKGGIEAQREAVAEEQRQVAEQLAEAVRALAALSPVPSGTLRSLQGRDRALTEARRSLAVAEWVLIERRALQLACPRPSDACATQVREAVAELRPTYLACAASGGHLVLGRRSPEATRLQVRREVWASCPAAPVRETPAPADDPR